MEIASIKIGDEEKFYDHEITDWSDINEGITYVGDAKPLRECNYKVSCIDSKSGDEILLDIHSIKEIRKGKLELLTTNGNTFEIEGYFEAVDKEV